MDKKIILLVMLGIGCARVSRMRGYDQKQDIDITASYKPVAPGGRKLKFNAAPPAVDTSNAPVAYNIPAQLSFAQIPAGGEMKPVALCSGI